jgi:CrcB protein
MKILLVGAGGCLGSMLRYWLTGWIHRWVGNDWFPYGTLGVNLIGCISIGFLGVLAEQRSVFSSEIRALVFIGILGGFTTFSAFAHDTVYFALHARPVAASLNVLLQLVLGLSGVWIGGLFAHLLRR